MISPVRFLWHSLHRIPIPSIPFQYVHCFLCLPSPPVVRLYGLLLNPLKSQFSSCILDKPHDKRLLSSPSSLSATSYLGSLESTSSFSLVGLFVWVEQNGPLLFLEGIDFYSFPGMTLSQGLSKEFNNQTALRLGNVRTSTGLSADHRR